MKNIIFHGSKTIVERPIFGFGKKYNDYGLGFYCTENKELAMEWAVDEGVSGYVNGYAIDTKDLNVVDLNVRPYTPLHWLSVLLCNRTFDIDLPLALAASDYIKMRFAVNLSTCDIVKGYRADDSYFMFARDFLSGGISYRQLIEAFHLGNLGEQFVLKSERAFERIEPLGYEIADESVWYHSKINRDSNARREYRSLKLPQDLKGELFITRILEEEIGPDDTRLQ